MQMNLRLFRRLTVSPFLLGTLAVVSCGQDDPSTVSTPGVPPPQDLAALQARVRLSDQEVAEAYRQEHDHDLPGTAQEVIDRYLDAVGGREAFDTIQTMVRRSTHHGTGGPLGTQVRYHRKPLYYRWEQSNAPVALVTDGHRFWWAGLDGWDEIGDGTSYLPAASMDNHFIDPQAMGLVHELVGVVAYDGTPGFEVRRTWPHGREYTFFFAAESGLLTLMRYPHPFGGEYWSSIWDYRDLGGLLLPFANITHIDFIPPHGMILSEIEINVPLPDSLFLPPEERAQSLPPDSTR